MAPAKEQQQQKQQQQKKKEEKEKQQREQRRWRQDYREGSYQGSCGNIFNYANAGVLFKGV